MTLTRSYVTLLNMLDRIAPILPPLLLRLILAWEFGEAGLEKLHGENWFADIVFPFPFNILPADFNWAIATWFELIGAGALIVGLATRFFSLSLIILTIVAALTVHMPAQWDTLAELWNGYRIIGEDGSGNFKLPLLYLIMLLPLLFGGAGKLSLDHLLSKLYKR
ncbi:DoxX family protein [Pseudomethylobacillus aquaticus]|uniref:DoxX family protein n=1 Tax=Pseudomethylobacillus aquaticus TaxID=2676064 RepID=A0A3N0V5J2_9PROT|nr:DoxX family protein [Pseudomethylobacillus aquaticus]ROH88077.1 DoxX family protein [Pseudomethylobacillus aquaticus]